MKEMIDRITELQKVNSADQAKTNKEIYRQQDQLQNLIDDVNHHTEQSFQSNYDTLRMIKDDLKLLQPLTTFAKTT